MPRTFIGGILAAGHHPAASFLPGANVLWHGLGLPRVAAWRARGGANSRRSTFARMEIQSNPLYNPD